MYGGSFPKKIYLIYLSYLIYFIINSFGSVDPSLVSSGFGSVLDSAFDFSFAFLRRLVTR